MMYWSSRRLAAESSDHRQVADAHSKQFPLAVMPIYSDGMNCPSRFVICGLVMAFSGAILKADTIQLNGGPDVTATVTKYANNNFEARSGDGRTATYSASNVRAITFEKSTAPAHFTTRNSGVQEGAPVTFANGRFTVTTANGNREFPLIFVERAAFVPDRGQEIEVITHGAQVDITKHLSSGNVTIVDFYADWCGPCKQISPALEQMARTDPEVALRKVDIVSWTTPVAKQFNLHSIPQVNVYGRKGNLIGTVRGANVDQVQRYVAQAKSGG
ncbi:MAG TPA: thioredoxin domain-containing protein [Chthoniobacterales bacterium]|jgi:thiol-disulfide isomerase/thioredoxin